MYACYHPVLRLSNGARIYPPLDLEHTYAEVLSAAEKAEAKHYAVKGILEMSPLSMLLDVDAVPIDYMYCCLEEVMRSRMKYRFNSSFHRNSFYLGHYPSEIDSKFLKQHPHLNLADQHDLSANN